MNREEFVLKALIAAANDIVAGNRKRRWLWFGIPPAASLEAGFSARAQRMQ
jgi:hypothetical protein